MGIFLCFIGMKWKPQPKTNKKNNYLITILSIVTPKWHKVIFPTVSANDQTQTLKKELKY